MTLSMVEVAKPELTLREIEFKNYKAFGHYRVSFQHVNLLVGPNNCGKSTIISSLRALAFALRTARSHRPEWIQNQSESRLAYPLGEGMPIPLENIHTDYSDKDTTVTFRFTENKTLQLYFPVGGGCSLTAIGEKGLIRSSSAFREAFPFDLAVVPVLGAMENREPLLTKETVRSNLMTHRASRHFRNYWHHYPDGFEEFAALVANTWPGMTISKPVLENVDPQELFMFAQERRIARELFWCGLGFQIWCQLLTHIARNQNADLLIVDEPEIYLHSDLQRQLLGILRGAGPAIVVATHSTELMGEADPSEIVFVDKTEKHSQRLKHVEAVQSALEKVGSIHNITLVSLARARRILYVEDTSDFDLLRRFAARLGLKRLAAGNAMVAIRSGGFGSWKEIFGAAKRIEEATGASFAIAAVYDRDYFPQEELDAILSDLRKHLALAHVLERKEIENYLLNPDVLDRIIFSLASKQDCNNELRTAGDVRSRDLLMKLTEDVKHDTQAQYVKHRCDYVKRRGGVDSSIIIAEATGWFDGEWSDLSKRICIVPGKEVLRRFKDQMQQEYKVSVSDKRIVDAFRKDEIPGDMQLLLQGLEEFSTA